MNDPLLIALGPSLLILIGGLITWIIKSKKEELQAIEETLREERRKVYMEILDPYFHLFMDPGGVGQDTAMEKILSYKYRKTSFELNLFGSDDVVSAYNTLLQYMYKAEREGEIDQKELFSNFGNFLLAIRKSLGIKKTELTNIDMLKSMIKDIETIM